MIKEKLLEAMAHRFDLNSNIIVSNIRHYNSLYESKLSIDRVLEGIESKIPTDLVAQDIRQILHYLGEITGEITTDEILGNIFKNFCIGK